MITFKSLLPLLLFKILWDIIDIALSEKGKEKKNLREVYQENHKLSSFACVLISDLRGKNLLKST